MTVCIILFLAYVSIWEPQSSSDISKTVCIYSTFIQYVLHITYMALLLGFGMQR